MKRTIYAAATLLVLLPTKAMGQENAENEVLREGQSPNISPALVPNRSASFDPPVSENTHALDTEKLAIAREIADIISPPESREKQIFDAMDQMMVQSIDATRKSRRESDPEIEAMIARHLEEMREEMQTITRRHIPNLIDGQAQAMANNFTARELDDIRAFAKTESGRSFLQSQNKLLTDPYVIEVNQKYFDEAMPIIPRIQRSLQAEILEYLTTQKQNSSTQS